MITDALGSFVTTIVTFVIGLLPTDAPPAWVGSVGSGLDAVMGAASTMGAWMPVGLLSSAVITVLSCVLIGLAIKLVRSVASYFLAGGGSSG